MINLETLDYPCLMENKVDKQVVLFREYGTGTVVHEGNSEDASCIGSYRYCLYMPDFREYKRKIELENK